MPIPASAISKGPDAPSSMKMRVPSSLPPFAAWIASCSSPNLTWKPYWKNCARMSTPKVPTTRQRPYRSAPSPRGLASAWPSRVTPRITPRKRCSSPFARRRMPDQRFLVVRLGSLGDIVHTFPAVAALRGSFPEAEIVWLRSEEHTSELQSHLNLVCRLLLEKKKTVCTRRTRFVTLIPSSAAADRGTFRSVRSYHHCLWPHRTQADKEITPQSLFIFRVYGLR